MALTLEKKWEIVGLDTIENFFQYQNYVRCINWKLSIFNTSSIDHPCLIYMLGCVTTSLPYDGNTYEDFQNITQEQMLNWIFEKLGPDKIQWEKELETHFLNHIHETSNISLTDKSPTFITQEHLKHGGMYHTPNFPLRFYYASEIINV